MQKQARFGGLFASWATRTLQIMALLNHQTPAARYSHLNLAAGEKRVDTVFAGVR